VQALEKLDSAYEAVDHWHVQLCANLLVERPHTAATEQDCLGLVLGHRRLQFLKREPVLGEPFEWRLVWPRPVLPPGKGWMAVLEAVPISLKRAISVGIGLFIAFIGFFTAGFVTKPAASPLPVGLGPLAGKIWRIGLMGYSCRPDNVMLCLSALGSVLSDMGLPVHVGDAEAAEALPEYIQIYEATATVLTRPYPGVRETLEELRRRGYRNAVCTNKLQQATMAVLAGLDLAPLFDGIAGGDRYPVRKPDPGHLLGLIGELGGSTGRASRRRR